MGGSFPKGWVRLRGKKWYGYFRRTELDPARVATTTDVYMQQLPESVRATVDSIHQELVGTASKALTTQMVN